MEVVAGLDVLGIQLGFDEGFLGYWLTIADDDGPTDELTDYIFHNMKDVPGVSMTVVEVEDRLAAYGIGLPHEVAEALVRDGSTSEYRQAIESGELSPKHTVQEFESFERRVVASSPREWMPRGSLPDLWIVDRRWHIHRKRGPFWKLRRWLDGRPRRT
jgi:hypothetical protein